MRSVRAMSRGHWNRYVPRIARKAFQSMEDRSSSMAHYRAFASKQNLTGKIGLPTVFLRKRRISEKYAVM
jgi:hypothetical protein